MKDLIKFILWAILIFLAIVGILALCIYFFPDAEAATISQPSTLWKGLIGEAVSEGYEGMYAVACVYRNRLIKGMPLGCVALKRRDLDVFIGKQGKKYEIMAKEIVYKVFAQADDITQGATHYENIERFGIPRWAKNMVRTVKIGSHTFYKEQ